MVRHQHFLITTTSQVKNNFEKKIGSIKSSKYHSFVHSFEEEEREEEKNMTAHVGLRHRTASSSFQRMEEKHNNHNHNHNNNSKNNNEENSPPSLNESSDDESGTNHSHSSSSIHSDTDSCTKDSSSGSSNNTSSSRSSVPLKPKRKSLEDRGAIPAGMMFGIASISVMQWCADVPQNFFGTILPNVKYTVIESVNDLKLTAVYGCDLIMDLIHWRERPLKEYFVALIVLAFLSSIFFVLLIAPLRAGMWTNRTRIKRHKLHRYFGLLFLIAYTFAWIEFIFDYENRGKNSYLPHIISINGKSIIPFSFHSRRLVFQWEYFTDIFRSFLFKFYFNLPKKNLKISSCDVIIIRFHSGYFSLLFIQSLTRSHRSWLLFG